MPDIRELTPLEFRQKWADPGSRDAVVLLDVREHAELELARIEGALHIPMHEIPQRIDELDPGKELVCICHGGGRSRRVAEYLVAQGFTRVINLTGGIDAWSVHVDPGVPRY
jgi:rhodanese-related sulfurtransferase